MTAQFNHTYTTINPLYDYITAGYGTITMQSLNTQKRYTYKFKKKKTEKGVKQQMQPTQPIFVSLLVSPGLYMFIGTLWQNPLRFTHSRKSTMPHTAQSIKAITWFIKQLHKDMIREEEKLFSYCSVWHEGTCCRCGRPLTVPESIESGIGPVCAGM